MLRLHFGILAKSGVFLYLICLVAVSSFAQMETATISGRVADPGGLSITGARVKLVDIDRETTTGATTND